MQTFLSDQIISVAPLLIMTFGAIFILLFEVFLNPGKALKTIEMRDWNRPVFTALILLLALFSNSYAYLLGKVSPGLTIFSGMLYSDNLSVYINTILIFISIFVVLVAGNRTSSEKIESPAEYYALILMSNVGALVFASAAEFITLFLGLEIMSMALYCLCGSAISRRGSSESALKYFFLGSFSSAFMLYGIALIYGLTGSTLFTEIAPKLASLDSNLLNFALALVVFGFLFKIAAVPFHFWAPDVYQGAPLPVTIYMSSVIKAAAFFAMIRVFSGVFASKIVLLTGAIWTVAVLTMVVGNLLALRQRSLKRMLAYSSVAHAGYMLTALLVPQATHGGVTAILYYLLAYSAMNIGAFAIVLAVSGTNSENSDSDDISNLNGLAEKSPFLAAMMSLFMLSLAGLPPGMAGLVGKLYIFGAAIKGGFIGLAIIGVLASAVSAYYYLRVIVAMYFLESGKEQNPNLPFADAYMKTVLCFCALAVILLGIFPGVIYDSANSVAYSFLHPR